MADKAFVEEIAQGLKQIKQMAENSLPARRETIDHFINSKEQDYNAIGLELDYLLDLVQIGVGDEEFKRLNNYLRTIHPESADFYDKEYQKMIEED